MKDIKAVVFDFDDTLGNRDGYAYLFYEGFLDKNYPFLNNNPLKKEAILQDLMIYDQLGDTKKEYCFKRISEKYSEVKYLDINYEEYYNSVIGDYTYLFDGTNELLNKLKNKYKLGILTNGTVFGQKGKLEHCLNLNLFDVVLISGETSFKKPQKELYEILINRLDLKPNEILMIGDNFSNDIYGAINAGLEAIWVCKDKNRINRTGIKRIGNIKELMDIL